MIIEDKIVNLIFERKPFTAIEITTELFPNDNSQYENVIRKIKNNISDFSEFYDAEDIEISITNSNTKKKENYIQTIYYPWEYNFKKYNKDFIFNPDFITTGTETSTTSSSNYDDDEYDELEDNKQEKPKPKVQTKKTPNVKTYFIEPTKPIEKPNVFKDEHVFQNAIEPIKFEIQNVTITPVKTEILNFSESVDKSIDTAIQTQNILLEEQHTKIIDTSIQKQTISIEEEHPKISDTTNIVISYYEEITKPSDQCTYAIKTENAEQSVQPIDTVSTTIEYKTEESKTISITESFMEQRTRYNTESKPIDKPTEKKLLANYLVERAPYKKDIVMIRSQALKLGLGCSFSMTILNKKIILSSSKNGVIHSDKRGLKINKSFLDLAGLPDEINIKAYSDKTIVYMEKEQ